MLQFNISLMTHSIFNIDCESSNDLEEKIFQNKNTSKICLTSFLYTHTYTYIYNNNNW